MAFNSRYNNNNNNNGWRKNSAETNTPGTLASLTSSKPDRKNYNSTTISLNDFPCLPMKKPINGASTATVATVATATATVVGTTNRPTFAQMSQEWALRKQELEAQAKKEADIAAEAKKRQLELDELERRSYKCIGALSSSTVAEKKPYKILDIGSNATSYDDTLNDDYQYDDTPLNDKIDSSDSEVAEDDNADSLWNNRRNRYDLY
jgi:hypothetical protein